MKAALHSYELSSILTKAQDFSLFLQQQKSDVFDERGDGDVLSSTLYCEVWLSRSVPVRTVELELWEDRLPNSPGSVYIGCPLNSLEQRCVCQSCVTFRPVCIFKVWKSQIDFDLRALLAPKDSIVVTQQGSGQRPVRADARANNEVWSVDTKKVKQTAWLTVGSYTSRLILTLTVGWSKHR